MFVMQCFEEDEEAEAAEAFRIFFLEFMVGRPRFFAVKRKRCAGVPCNDCQIYDLLLFEAFGQGAQC